MQDYETDLPSTEINLNIKTGSQEVAKLIEGAMELDAQNQKDPAMRMIDNALRIEPHNPSLYYLMARCLFDVNNTGIAREAIEKAVYLAEDDPNYFKLQGDIYRRCGLPDKAISSYNRSLKLDGRNVPALNNLGNTYREQERLDEAQKYLNLALDNDANFVPARYNLALVLIDNRDMAAAEAELLICAEKAPTVPDIWFSLAQILVSEEKPGGAISLLEKAVNHCPDSTDLCLRLIKLYEDVGRDSKAVPLYKKVDQLDPSIAEEYQKQSSIQMNRLMQTSAQDFANRAAKLNEKYIRNQLFMSSYLAVEDIETCFQRHLDWNAGLKVKEARNNHFAHSVKPGKDRILRIGYVSPDFYNHAVSWFATSILRNHNRSEVEVFCYANMHAKADNVTARLKALSDHWREIQDLSDYQAARLINRDNIDVLIDLSGHTRGSRTSLFAFKPAPIQASYLGYPGSSGLTEIDYWITDHLIHPIDTTEPSSETKYRLNRNWIAYGTEDGIPPLTEKPAGAPITFGVINHIGKHSREFINMWGQILKRNPDARLLVKSVEFQESDLRIKVIDYLEELGVDRQRLTLTGQTLNHKEHLDVYNGVDVCLDPFPYNGGTSTADALAMGVPVITLAGDTLKGRMALAILTASGFPQWIVDSHEAYEQMATDRAQTGTSLKEKQRIRDTFLGSEVCDGPGLVKELERAYRNMLEGYSDVKPTLH